MFGVAAVRAAKVDDMVNSSRARAHGVDVVARRRDGGIAGLRVIARMAIAVIVIMALGVLCMAERAMADESTPSRSSDSSSGSASSSASASSSDSASASLNDSITDTENLLGSDFSRVSDAITETRKTTGVSVRLLYVAHFPEGKKPASWAANLLNSLEPPSNTVMLAVGSDDGSLVVAVSSNSDSWLRSQSSVDALSDAAAKPLMSENGRDWAASALALMSQISTLKHSSTSSTASWIGVGILIAGLAVLIVVAVVVTKRRRRRHAAPRRAVRARGAGGTKRRRSRSAGRSRSTGRSHGRTPRHGRARGLHDDDTNPRNIEVTEHPERIQETSSDGGDSEKHEQND